MQLRLLMSHITRFLAHDDDEDEDDYAADGEVNYLQVLW